MRILLKILLGILIIFVLIQLIPQSVNKSSQSLPTDFIKVYSVPRQVQSIFEDACYDCHSNNTRYPWYSKIQPFRIWLDGHIKTGKEELNFSEFGSYSSRRQYNKLNSIAESVKKRTMPLRSYEWMHSEARLNDNQKKMIIKWVNDIRDSIKAKR